MLRFLGWLFGFGLFVALAGAVGAGIYVWDLTKDLPDYTVLKDYSPPVTTRVHAADGTLLAEYARERRLFQPIETIPPRVADAFISAEDKDFYKHNGIDIPGIIRAVRNEAIRMVTGDSGRIAGASTITQQVAKNFFLTPKRTIQRKIREAILAIRIDSTFSKDKILELYLNEIYLGLNSYGVASASLNYFDKALYELKLSQIAYLAALPKGPNNYNPYRDRKAAISRRNWVLDRMAENGYVTQAQADKAKKDPLGVSPRHFGTQLYAADYFTEAVRRQLADMYGDKKLYGGGLSVRTTLDPKLQEYARKALMDGLVNFDHEGGYRGPVATIDTSKDWGPELNKISPLNDVPEWKLAVVLKMDTNEATIGLRPKTDAGGKVDKKRLTGTMPGRVIPWVKKKLHNVLKVGDVVYVKAVKGEDGVYTLEQVPKIQGAIVAMDPRTGRVLAMVGGFSFDESQFNRATQAMRQPGSAFKPIVYSAALDNGYTPASVVLDAPIEIQNADGTVWKPQNYEQQFYGPQTLRTGLVHSRNVMTVRLAKDIGMPLIAEYAKLFGVSDHLMPVLSMALGAGETTLLKLTSAYATIANGGRKIDPTMIDRIQDRYGKTIYRHDDRACEGCNVKKWDGQPPPHVIDNRKQILDPMTAYQITSMMEGVVQSGTGSYVKRLNRPVAGKTGTTTDYKDAWFLGFTPSLVCGVYMGYDTPKSMGHSATGGRIAAPIFTEFMQKALKGKPPTPFTMPPGMTQAWIDPQTGVQTVAGGNAIREAFKPGTGPNQTTSVIGVDSNAFQNLQDGTNPDVGAGRGGLF